MSEKGNYLTKLPDKLRRDFDEATMYNKATARLIAAELEAALPKWTKITDEPATFPNTYPVIVSWDYQKSDGLFKTYVMLAYDLTDIKRNVYNHFDCYWRPLCDLDYPQENDGE